MNRMNAIDDESPHQRYGGTGGASSARGSKKSGLLNYYQQQQMLQDLNKRKNSLTKFNHTQSLSGLNRYPSSDEEERKGGTNLNSYKKVKNMMQRTSSVSSMSKAGKLDEIIKKS